MVNQMVVSVSCHLFVPTKTFEFKTPVCPRNQESLHDLTELKQGAILKRTIL